MSPPDGEGRPLVTTQGSGPLTYITTAAMVTEPAVRVPVSVLAAAAALLADQREREEAARLAGFADGWRCGLAAGSGRAA